MNVFEVVDKTGRLIRLTKERWTHITQRHPTMAPYVENVKDTVEYPHLIIAHSKGNLYDYYTHHKYKKGNLKFLQVVIKYLNGGGFILSAYFVQKIRR